MPESKRRLLFYFFFLQPIPLIWRADGIQSCDATMHNYIGTDICTGIWMGIEIHCGESISRTFWVLLYTVPSSLGSIGRVVADVSYLMLDMLETHLVCHPFV